MSHSTASDDVTRSITDSFHLVVRSFKDYQRNSSQRYLRKIALDALAVEDYHNPRRISPGKTSVRESSDDVQSHGEMELDANEAGNRMSPHMMDHAASYSARHHPVPVHPQCSQLLDHARKTEHIQNNTSNLKQQSMYNSINSSTHILNQSRMRFPNHPATPFHQYNHAKLSRQPRGTTVNSIHHQLIRGTRSSQDATGEFQQINQNVQPYYLDGENDTGENDKNGGRHQYDQDEDNDDETCLDDIQHYSQTKPTLEHSPMARTMSNIFMEHGPTYSNQGEDHNQFSAGPSPYTWTHRGPIAQSNSATVKIGNHHCYRLDDVQRPTRGTYPTDPKLLYHPCNYQRESVRRVADDYICPCSQHMRTRASDFNEGSYTTNDRCRHLFNNHWCSYTTLHENEALLVPCCRPEQMQLCNCTHPKAKPCYNVSTCMHCMPYQLIHTHRNKEREHRHVKATTFNHTKLDPVSCFEPPKIPVNSCFMQENPDVGDILKKHSKFIKDNTHFDTQHTGVGIRKPNSRDVNEFQQADRAKRSNFLQLNSSLPPALAVLSITSNPSDSELAKSDMDISVADGKDDNVHGQSPQDTKTDTADSNHKHFNKIDEPSIEEISDIYMQEFGVKLDPNLTDLLMGWYYSGYYTGRHSAFVEMKENSKSG